MEKTYLDSRGQRLEVRKDRGVHLIVPCAALRFDRLGKSRDGIDVLGFPSATSGQTATETLGLGSGGKTYTEVCGLYGAGLAVRKGVLWKRCQWPYKLRDGQAYLVGFERCFRGVDLSGDVGYQAHGRLQTTSAWFAEEP